MVANVKLKNNILYYMLKLIQYISTFLISGSTVTGISIKKNFILFFLKIEKKINYKYLEK